MHHLYTEKDISLSFALLGNMSCSLRFLVRSSVTNVFTRTKHALSEHTLHDMIVLCDSRELRSKLLSCT